MKLVRFLCITIFALSLFGCANQNRSENTIQPKKQHWTAKFKQPTDEEIAKANYGKYPKDYQKQIKNIINPQLKDPYSAQYEFYEPVKAVLFIYGTDKPTFTYMILAKVNAKNSYGGYTGYSDYFFLGVDSVVIDITNEVNNQLVVAKIIGK